MSRTEILDRIRKKLAVDSEDKTRLQVVESRLANHLPNTIPSRCRQSHSDLVDLFQEKMEKAHGTVNRVNNDTDLGGEIMAYLGDGSFELCINVLEFELDFSAYSSVQTVEWTPRSSLDICISDCFGAVAETGSLVISSSKQMPLSFNFLGEKHIVLLKEDQIMGAYEDIWARTRNDMPRDITLVSGPSCTGDIEMIMEFGAHGPKELHIIIIGS
ncbi:MAG: lactate utilization protein [Pseudomonadales bacterium]|nr:lactate utilization protein [Pseudomonadales bacterium]